VAFDRSDFVRRYPIRLLAMDVGKMSTGSFKIAWIDSGREPKCPPNPAYPNGIDLDAAEELGVPTCKTALPYPAKRCGYYCVECNICGSVTVITTAGRIDDPRSVLIPCKMRGTKQ
jgi:hypothetical protein